MASKKRNRTYILLSVVIVSLIILLLVIDGRHTQEPDAESAVESDGEPIVEPTAETPKEIDTSTEKSTEKSTESGLSKRAGRLFIIIDDVGYNTSQLKPFLKLDYPIIFSVLPGLTHTREAAEKIAANGKEVMLHLPMEAKNGEDPGPGAVYADMDKSVIETIVGRHFDELPEAKAFNNHMGSLITEDPEIMEVILEVAKARNIIYIDSLTTPKSAVPAVSKKLNIPYYSRDIFLDNKKDKASIAEAYYNGIKTASREGRAILIGHIGSAALVEVIRESDPLLEEFDVEIAGLENLVELPSLKKEDTRERTWH